MNYESFWSQQKNSQWKILTNPLKDNPQLHSQLNIFITTFYWKFRKKKGLNKIHPQVKFQGFKKFEVFSEETKMGHCEAKDLTNHWQEVNGKKIEGSEYWKGTISIVLNQKLLLDKLGMDKWFSSERSYLPVGFDELIGTIAHELAHAYQYIANLGKSKELSQCESTGRRDINGNLLYPELAAEHTALTEEIKSLIESSAEYQKFKVYWKEGKGGLEEAPAKFSSDKVENTANRVGDASSEFRKTGEEKSSQSLGKDKWPRWVLPVLIGVGVLLLIGVIGKIFRRKMDSKR